MGILVLAPVAAFLVLLLAERICGRTTFLAARPAWDWTIHLSGFLMQGAVIPLFGFLVATRVLPAAVPEGAGALPIGWWGAFLLNFVAVDFLYYWQHRAFHGVPTLWKLHLCHHTTQRVDVWVTSRNSLLLHFLLVPFLFNPTLGYLVTRPDAFFVGATATACLDLFRHAHLRFGEWPGTRRLASCLGLLFVLPSAHHRHHAERDINGNYGANLILWDRLFGTYLPQPGYPASYGVREAPPPLEQWLRPLKRRAPDLPQV